VLIVKYTYINRTCPTDSPDVATFKAAFVKLLFHLLLLSFIARAVEAINFLITI